MFPDVSFNHEGGGSICENNVGKIQHIQEETTTVKLPFSKFVYHTAKAIASFGKELLLYLSYFILYPPLLIILNLMTATEASNAERCDEGTKADNCIIFIHHEVRGTREVRNEGKPNDVLLLITLVHQRGNSNCS